MKKPVIVIAGIALIGLFLALRKKKDIKQEVQAPAPVAPTTAAVDEPSIQNESLAADLKVQEVRGNQQKVAAAARQMGLKKLPFAKKDGFWEIDPHVTSSQKKCEVGDFDLIRIDQKRRRIDNFVVAIDDLGKRKNLFYQKLSLASLTDSPIHLRWKAEPEQRSFALALCSDVKNSKSCASANIADINQSLDTKGPAPDADRIYYFQYLQEGEQLAMLDSSRPQARNSKELNQLLEEQSVAPDEAARVSEKVGSANLMIGSMAADVTDGGLSIDLPHNDPACPLPQLNF